jgi:hypothetical protein
MIATLQDLGFDVTSGVNINQREMKRLIREFGKRLKGGGAGLFYYAGHGVQMAGRNYLIPVEADIQTEADLEDAGVDLALVLNYMDDAQNGLNFVILDACRNNPFSRGFRSASGGLAQVDAPTGTLIAYATAPGRVAADGTGKNGLYTSALLKAMRVPGLSATEMFMRVRAEVMGRTGNKQVPWEASSLVGSFYFMPPKIEAGRPSGAANETRSDPGAFELSYWESIKGSTDPKDFQSYLEEYPNGQFVSLARNNLRRLEEAGKRDDPPTKVAVEPTNVGSSPGLTEFRRLGLSFNYPSMWSFQDTSNNDAQQMTFGRTDSEAQITVFVFRTPLTTPEKVAEAKRVLVDKYVASTTKSFEQAGGHPQSSPATSEIGGVKSEGVKIRASLDGVPGIAEIQSAVVGQRLVVLTLLGPDKAVTKAAPVWDAIRTTIKIAEPQPQTKPQPKPSPKTTP